jgi:hypothetical protein
MTRKKPDVPKRTHGELLEHNLVRLGYGATVIRTAEIARLVSASGRPMSRQRIAALVNARRIEPETIEAIAKGLGVAATELIQPPG